MTGAVAIIGIVALFCLMALSWGKQLQELLAKKREKRQFDEFDDALSGKQDDPDQALKYFSGEVLLEQLVCVFVPEPVANPAAMERMQTMFETAGATIEEAGLGKVVRFTMSDDLCGFDVMLNDFVNGVDLLRKTLIELEAPQGTLIEYSKGDLPIYE